FSRRTLMSGSGHGSAAGASAVVNPAPSAIAGLAMQQKIVEITQSVWGSYSHRSPLASPSLPGFPRRIGACLIWVRGNNHVAGFGRQQQALGEIARADSRPR